MTSDGTTGTSRGWRVHLALLAVVLLALAVRLFFASFGPGPGRFHDERYALENVAEVLRTGELRPVSGYHPSLSWLPQVVVLGPLYLADEAFFGGGHVLRKNEPYRPGGRQPPIYPWEPLTYQVGRSFQAALGALAVLVTFLIGRRLWGPVEGLVGAALLACSPVAVRQSSLINEDAMLILSTALAVLWALHALDDPSRRTYLLAGVGIGLAASSKFNAFPVVLPLVVGSLFLRRPLGRRVVLLGWAALAAVGTFLVLNPFLLLDWEIYTRDFGRTLRLYDRHATVASRTHFEVFAEPFTAMLNTTLLGRLGGALALTGVVGVVLRVLRRRRPGEAALVSMVLGYPAVYAVATRNTNFTNWLPIVPYFALAAGYLWAALFPSGTLPPRRRWAAAAAWALVPAVAIAPLLVTGASVAIPTTAEAAAGVVQRASGSGVAMVQEALEGVSIPNRDMAVVTVPYLMWLPVESLRGADALIFPDEEDRAHPVPPVLFRQPWVDRVVRVEPSPLRRRGPALRVVLVPWKAAGKSWVELLPAGPGKRLSGRVRDLEAPWVSLEVTLPPGRTSPPSILLDGRPVELHWARSKGGRDTYVSLRVRRPPRSPLPLELLAPAGTPPVEEPWWVLVEGWEPG